MCRAVFCRMFVSYMRAVLCFLRQLCHDDAVQASGSGGVRGRGERRPLRVVRLSGGRLHRRTAGVLQLLHQQTHHPTHQRRRPQQRQQSAAALHPESTLSHHYGNRGNQSHSITTWHFYITSTLTHRSWAVSQHFSSDFQSVSLSLAGCFVHRL